MILSFFMAPFAYAVSERAPNSVELKSIKSALANRLKDPDSIKLSEIRVKDDYVCGFINAKNSYGGYTGKKPFYGMLMSQGRLFGVVGIGDNESEAVIITNMCVEKFKTQ